MPFGLLYQHWTWTEGTISWGLAEAKAQSEQPEKFLDEVFNYCFFGAHENMVGKYKLG